MAKQTQSPYIPLMAMRGITQTEIAKTLGVTKNTVSNWFTGKTPARLTLEEWRKLADLMGTSIENLPSSFAPQPINNPNEPPKA